MENQEKIQHLQILEQNLQRILMQKNSYQMDLAETESALNEVKKSEGDVHRIIGQLMIKVSKEKVISELEDKKKKVDSKVKALEKQEKEFVEQSNSLREEIFSKKE